MAQAANCLQGCKEFADLEEEIEAFREEFEQEIICHAGENLESDLSLRVENCKKNPGHEGFIPVKDLEVCHLPPEWRDPWVSRMVRALSKHVVKLTVRYTSLERPDGYCVQQLRGTSLIRLGTGKACLDRGDLLKEPQPCPFEDCREVEGSHLVTPYFIVTTASHVVFDTSEAQKTKVAFFLDSEEDQAREIHITARGVRCDVSSGLPSADACVMTCVSHDLDLFRQLLSFPKQELLTLDAGLKGKGREPLVVIPSYPHGCSKQVSVGTCTGIEMNWSHDVFKINTSSRLEGGGNALAHTSQESRQNENLEDVPHSFYSNLVAQFDPFLLSKTDPDFVSEFMSSLGNLFPKPQHSKESIGRACSSFTQRSNCLDTHPFLWFSNMLYSTPTCPGSSGAPVMVFYEQDGFVDIELVSRHSGTKHKKNVSGFLDFLPECSAFQHFAETLRGKMKTGKTGPVSVMDLDLD